MKTPSIRLLYPALIGASFLYLGAGDIRAFLLTLITTLSLASTIERALCVHEGVSIILHLTTTAVGALIFYFYQDIAARAFTALCIIAPLLIYVLIKYEEERVEEEENSSIRMGEDASSPR